MQPVVGVVQHYAWGDRSFIPQLLGKEPDGRPWAELWLGTHPNGPTTMAGVPLADTTGPLPYLLKVLAAAEPLSLQAHPTRQQAIAGFAAGRYPDDQPKPELLMALTPFSALCGVRPVEATLELLGNIGAAELATLVDRRGPGVAMHDLYRGQIAIEPIIEACHTATEPEAALVRTLAARYPGDVSVVVTLLLNHVTLAPGEAIVLGPGNLHAYLHGAGIELMGASDNVVRGGLTTKPVDIDDLLDVVDPTPLADPVRPAATEYPLDGTGITLLRLLGPTSHVATSHELVVTSRGTTGYLAPGASLTVPAGDVAHVAAST